MGKNSDLRSSWEDLNTGLSDDVESTRFKRGDSFERLLATGWDDACRIKNGAREEFSWYRNAKNEKGFRMDHAFVSDPVQRRRSLHVQLTPDQVIAQQQC